MEDELRLKIGIHFSNVSNENGLVSIIRLKIEIGASFEINNYGYSFDNIRTNYILKRFLSMFIIVKSVKFRYFRIVTRFLNSISHIVLDRAQRCLRVLFFLLIILL